MRVVIWWWWSLFWSELYEIYNIFPLFVVTKVMTTLQTVTSAKLSVGDSQESLNVSLRLQFTSLSPT